MASRTYFASQAVALGRTDSTAVSSGTLMTTDDTTVNGTGFSVTDPSSYTCLLNGVQSVGISSSVDFTQFFELGHVEIFENVEGIPSCELTIERILPLGHPTLYEMVAASPTAGITHTSQTIAFASDNLLSVRLGINPYGSSLATSGVAFRTATTAIQVDGYSSNYSITASTDSPLTETLTIAGINLHVIPSGVTNTTERVKNPIHAQGVFRKQDIDVILQPVSGNPNAIMTDIQNAQFDNSHIVGRPQSCTLSISVGREDLVELGSKPQYMKYATYPFECTAEYEVNMDEAPYKDSFNVNQAYGPASSYEYAAGFNTDTCQLSPERGYVVGMRMLRTSPDCLGPNEVPSEYLACDVSISGAKLTGQSFSGGGVDGSPMTLSSSFSAYNAFRARSFVFPGSP